MESISKDMKDTKVIGSNLHWFIKGKSCSTNLIPPTAFCNELTGLVREGRAVGTVYREFRKAFATASRIILISKLVKYGRGKWTVRWTEI